MRNDFRKFILSAANKNTIFQFGSMIFKRSIYLVNVISNSCTQNQWKSAAETAQVVHSGAVAEDLQAAEYRRKGNSNKAAGVAPVSRGKGAVAVRLESAEYLFGPWWISAEKKLTRSGRYQDSEVQRELLLRIQNII